MPGERSVPSESELPFFSDLLDSTIKKNGKKLKVKMAGFIKARRRLDLIVFSQSIIDGGLFSVGMVALLTTFTPLPMWALYLISFAFGSGVLTAGLAAAGMVEIHISGVSTADNDKEPDEKQKDKAQKKKQRLETLHNVLNATATSVPLAVTLIGHYAQPFAPLSSGLTQFFLSHTALGLMGATIAVAGITFGIGLVITLAVAGLQYYLEYKAEKYRAEMRAYNRIQKAQRQLEFLKKLAESDPKYTQDKYFQAAKQGMLFKDELFKDELFKDYYDNTARKFNYMKLSEEDKKQATSLMSERASQISCGVISLFAGLAIGIGVVAFIGTIGAVTGGFGLIPIIIGVVVGLTSSGLFYAGYNDTLLRAGRELSVTVKRRYGLSNGSDLVSIPSTNTSLFKKIITNPAVITAFFGVIVLMSAPVLGPVVAVVLGVVAGAIVFGLSYYVKHRNQKLAQLAEKGKVRKHEFLEFELLSRDKAEKIEAEAKANDRGQEVPHNKGNIAVIVPVGASLSHGDLGYSPGPTPRVPSPTSNQGANDAEIEDGFELFVKAFGSKVECTPEAVLRLLDEKSKKDDFSLSEDGAKETMRKGICGLAKFVGDKITSLENALEKEDIAAVQTAAVQKEISKWMEVVARFKTNFWSGVDYMAVLRNTIFNSELKFDPRILAAVIKEDKCGVFTDTFLTRYLPYELASDEKNFIRKALYENLEEAVKSCNRFARQNLVVAFKKHFPNPLGKSLDKLTYARNWINRFSKGYSEVKPFPDYQRGVITQQQELKEFSDNLFKGEEEKRLLLLGSRPMLNLVGKNEFDELGQLLIKGTPPVQTVPEEGTPPVTSVDGKEELPFEKKLKAINDVLKAKSGSSFDITLWDIICIGLRKRLTQNNGQPVGELKIAIQSMQEVSELFDASGQVRQIGGLSFLTSQKEIDAYLQQISSYLFKLGVISGEGAITVKLLDRASFYDHDLTDARTGEVIKFWEYKKYIDALVKEYESNDLTYAHCYSGKERSPQVVGALMLSENIKACSLLVDSYSHSAAGETADKPTVAEKKSVLSHFFQTPCEIFESISDARGEAKKFSSMTPQQQRVIFKLFFTNIYKLDDEIKRQNIITAFANKRPSIIVQNLDMYFRTLAPDGRDISTVEISKESTAYKVIKLLFKELKKMTKETIGDHFEFKNDIRKLLIKNELITQEDLIRLEPMIGGNRLVKVLRNMSFFAAGDKPAANAYQSFADFIWENKKALEILYNRSQENEVDEDGRNIGRGEPFVSGASEALKLLFNQKDIVALLYNEKPESQEAFKQNFSLWCESHLEDARKLNELLESEAGLGWQIIP